MTLIPKRQNKVYGVCMFAWEVVLRFCFQDGDVVDGIKLFFPLYGRLMPMALITDEIVLAVYIPHAPAPVT